MMKAMTVKRELESFKTMTLIVLQTHSETCCQTVLLLLIIMPATVKKTGENSILTANTGIATYDDHSVPGSVCSTVNTSALPESPCIRITSTESIQMLGRLAVRNHLSDSALEDVLAAIRVHLPVSVEIPRHLKSLYLFRQSAMTDLGTETTAVLPHTVICVKTAGTLLTQMAAVDQSVKERSVPFYELSIAQQIQGFFRGMCAKLELCVTQECFFLRQAVFGISVPQWYYWTVTSQ